jgi:hypothetical protein
VQENNDGRLVVPGFTVKNLRAIYDGVLVADHRNPPLEMSERAFASLAKIR